MVQCPQCGEDYNQLSQHWNGNSCEWESFTKKQDEIIQGLLIDLVRDVQACVGINTESKENVSII